MQIKEKIKIAYFLGVFPKVSNTFINDEIRQFLHKAHDVEVYSLRLFDFKDAEDILSNEHFKGAFSLLEIISSRFLCVAAIILTSVFNV